MTGIWRLDSAQRLTEYKTLLLLSPRPQPSIIFGHPRLWLSNSFLDSPLELEELMLVHLLDCKLCVTCLYADKATISYALCSTNVGRNACFCWSDLMWSNLRRHPSSLALLIRTLDSACMHHLPVMLDKIKGYTLKSDMKLYKMVVIMFVFLVICQFQRSVNFPRASPRQWHCNAIDQE